MTMDQMVQATIDAFNSSGIIIILCIGLWLGVFVVKHFLEVEIRKEKPKRQAVEIGDDGELTEDWEP